MLERLNHRLGHYFLLIAVGSCLFLVNLGGPALWDLDEGRNATAALEMRESGDWIVPRFNGEIRTHKPALLYWLQVIAYTVFGVTEFAARLPSALAALLTILLVYELGRRMFDSGTGLLGGLILASTALFCIAAHFANPDALLVAFTTATLLCVWLGLSSCRRVWYAAAGATTGLAVLAKGPVGLVLPCAVVAFFLVWSRQWMKLFDRVWLIALLLCALVALPWYVQVTLDTRHQFLSEFFLSHNIDRALNPMEGHRGPPWYYFAVLLVGFSPWSAFFGSAVWYGLKEVRGAESGVRSPTPDTGHRTPDLNSVNSYRFLWCWIGVYLVAFTLAATKLPNYVAPMLPPLALVIAHFLERWRRGELQLPGWIQPTSLAALAFVGVATALGTLIAGGAIETELVGVRSFPGLERWAALGAIPILGAAGGLWCFWWQRKTAFVAVMVLMAVSFLGSLAAGGNAVFGELRSPRPLVYASPALKRTNEVRVACFQLEHLPSLNFYVQRNVQHHQCDRDVMDFLRQELQVFLFLPRTQWERLEPAVLTQHHVVATHYDMYRDNDVVVVTNR